MYRSRVVRVLAGFAAGVIFTYGAVAVAADPPIRLLVNNQDISFTEAPPAIVSGRAVVPARPLAEALGATVTWDAERRAVVVTSRPQSATNQSPTEPIITHTQDEKWIDFRDLAWEWGLRASIPDPSSGIMRFEHDGHSVEMMVRRMVEFSGVSDLGVTVREKAVNGFLCLNKDDLKAAKLIHY